MKILSIVRMISILTQISRQMLVPAVAVTQVGKMVKKGKNIKEKNILKNDVISIVIYMMKYEN